MKEFDNARVGVEIGDHSQMHEDYLKYLTDHYNIEKLGFVLFYTKPRQVPDELFCRWAEFFKEHGIYFAFLYTQQQGAPEGKKSHLRPEIVKKIKDIAGPLFVGDMIGETGGMLSWQKGYFGDGRFRIPPCDTVSEAERIYRERVRSFVELDRSLGVEDVLAVEATALARESFAAGVSKVFLETMCASPELLMPFVRGATRGYGGSEWGAHIAHEWYGGLRHDDPLKYKRLELAYKYSYLSGAKYIYSESGDCGIAGYGYEYGAESGFCREYRRVWSEFADFAKRDCRPAGGPRATVAFVHGKNDGFTGWGGGTLWGQFDREEWGFGDAEQSWDILLDSSRHRAWHEVDVYGDEDMTSAPPYGMVDVIPCEAPLEAMQRYDHLIFAGYNTMTEELYEKLKAYTAGGGNLFMTAAHLNMSERRDGEIRLINGGDVEDLFGCRAEYSGRKSTTSAKFIKESLMEGVLYPATGTLVCDSVATRGYSRYADLTVTSGRVAAVFDDCFKHDENREYAPVLVEKRHGRGVASLLRTVDYPGSSAVYPLYRTIVREIMTAAARRADVRVLACDKVKYAVYGDNEKIYLLNTSFDLPQCARVFAGGKAQDVTLAPLELMPLDI